MKLDLFLDSGAFTAKSTGETILLEDYISFIERYGHFFTAYANLDVIGSDEATWENQKIMESRGLSPLPVFHMEDNPKYLHECLKYSYFCLGGMAKGTTRDRLAFLDNCWNVICATSDGLPKSKVHGFGMTAVMLIHRYPWYSVDSTSWVFTSRTGSVFIPKYISGQYCYKTNPHRLFFSDYSPATGDVGKHFTTLTAQEQIEVTRFLSMHGLPIGKSVFEKKQAGYLPRIEDGERYASHPLPSGEVLVEKIIEPGLCNEYAIRDIALAIYFKGLANSIPEWPWPFRPKIRAFNL